MSRNDGRQMITEKPLDVEDVKLILQNFGYLDYAIFVIMLFISVGIGYYFGFCKSKTKPESGDIEHGTEELNYLVGNRKMKIFPVSMSLVASFVSGISLIGLSTEIYVYGILYAFTVPTIILAGFICWYVFLPVFCQLEITSIYEYFEMRFDKKIRLFGSVVNLIGITFWMPMVIYVPGLVFNQMTGIDVYVIVTVLCIVCIFYTSIGGISAVVWNDFFQSFIMLGSVILVMVKGLLSVGGFDEVLKRNLDSERLEFPELTWDPTVRYSLLAILIGGTISWTESTCCGQVMMQRFLSVPSVKEARKVLVFYVIGVTILFSICIFNGLLIYAYYYDCDPMSTKIALIKDQLLPLYIMDVFYKIPGLIGFFASGILSAALSTLSTGLNSLAAICLEDFIKPNIKKPLTEKHMRILLRIIVLVFGIISFGLVFIVQHLGMIFQLSRTLGSVSSGPLFGLFLIGVLMPWVNSKSVLIGGSISFITMAWICANAQISISRNEINLPTKPVSVRGCSYEFNYNINCSTSENLNVINIKDGIHFISYLWYTPLGAFLTIVIANLAVIFVGYIPRIHWKKKLIVPFLRKYVVEDVKIKDEEDENLDKLL